MSDVIARDMITALLPPGSAWEVVDDGDYDLMLEGIADGRGEVIDFLRQLSIIRNPFLTPYLSDLEREYGVSPDNRLTDATRRMRLAVKVYQGNQNSTEDDLQTALDSAGFNVQVHQNDPAVDPATFLTEAFQMVAGGDNAYAGFIPMGGSDITAVAGRIGGELLVNGDTFIQYPAWIMSAGFPTAVAGNEDAVAGRFDELTQDLITYTVPTDQFSWPFIFFVGGDATRDPVTGALTAIERAQVDTEREEDFKRIILERKPMHTWAGLIITFV